MKAKHFFVGLAFLTLGASVACANGATGNTKEVSAKTETNESAIKHIDAAYMRAHIYDYTENTGKFVLKGKRPVVLDFYANWCGPCRRLSPKLEEVATKYKGQVDVYKINVDDERELARIFGVRSIPMVLFVPVDGTPIQTLGDLPMGEIEKNIAAILP